MKTRLRNILYLSFIGLLACTPDSPQVSTDGDAFAPSVSTIAKHQQLLTELPFSDKQDFTDANRGLIAQVEQLSITNKQGKTIWDQSAYEFIQGQAPFTVNPSLWRQAKLNNIHGLFEVTPGIYQLRGFDLANMTLIDSDSGWILVDPLTAKETAKAALTFARKHLGNKAIVAVIYTHSHIDHFGGVLGVLNDQELATVRVIAPQGFMDEATSENVIAGAVMGRRASYMYGRNLPVSDRGHVGSGLGKTPAYGSIGLLPPTEHVSQTGQKMNIDGVEFEFQHVPNSEAPAELTFYLPKYKAFCGAELISRNMHNLYTLRGAKVRDALKWSAYIDQAIQLYGNSDIYFASHHWPLWGNTKIIDFLEKQRDTYKFIHDQTLHLASQGHTPREIAEQLRLPPSLAQSFPNRGYYGSTAHNAKAVYQFYFGWYDGNPANLNSLPPESAATRYLKAMGGTQKVYALAQTAYAQADYQWSVELLNHLVFSGEQHQGAKQLLAQNYHQLAYQAESAPWRDVYLSAAQELLQGVNESANNISAAADLLKQTPIDQFLNLMATMLNAEQAESKNLAIKIQFSDLQRSYILDIKNAVLHHRLETPGNNTKVNASIILSHSLFIDMLTGKLSAREIIFSDQLSLEGSKLDLLQFFALLEGPNNNFNIITP